MLFKVEIWERLREWEIFKSTKNLKNWYADLKLLSMLKLDQSLQSNSMLKFEKDWGSEKFKN